MTSPAAPPTLDEQSLRMFERKGREDCPDAAAGPNPNAVCVRRIMQLVEDFAHKPLAEVRILDLGCGEGVYAVEAALRGCQVTAVDGRPQRMAEGIECARRNGLTNLRFQQQDVRTITKASHGEFDFVWLLGILYHLDVPDAFSVLENCADICRGVAILDTHVALRARATAEHRGEHYEGCRFREHAASDPAEVRQGRLLASLDNPQSFWFTRESLVRLLHDVGFTSVLECHAPPDPTKQPDRLTLAAFKGTATRLSTYPWINGQSEGAIAQRLRPGLRTSRGPRALAKRALHGLLGRFGWELRRLR